MKFFFSLIILLSSVGLDGCMQHPSLAEQQRPQHWGSVISQPHNLYQISHDIYRSEQPSNELIPTLKTYQITTVINLRARNEDASVLKDQAFNLIHIPINTWAIDREDLLAVMRSIQTAKKQNHKVLIHCYHGSDRTGTSIAMYRIIFENWSIEDAVNEMKQGGYGFHVIWKNIDYLFTPENVKWIRQQMMNSSS